MDERAKNMRIIVGTDGPYYVSGDVPLLRVEIVTNEAGESVAWRETERLEVGGSYALCRCGESGGKPFCDGSHIAVGFDGTETATRDPYQEQAASIEGPGILLRDARKLCAEARFCDRAGGLWNLVEQCDDPEIRALAEEEAALCPSGRYTSSNPETGELNEPDLEPSIALVEDPSLGVSGPLWVRGGITVTSQDGTEHESRNRVTLCRCGKSANKPFCDGSHVGHGFHERP
jgi:CDGSH-type Zn-finger protein